MKDDEIIKVFEYCILDDSSNECCKCPAYKDEMCTTIDIGQQVLQLVNRQKAEIKEKKFLPYQNDRSGYPVDINIEFGDGRVIKYKRS